MAMNCNCSFLRSSSLVFNLDGFLYSIYFAIFSVGDRFGLVKKPLNMNFDLSGNEKSGQKV